MRGREIGRNAAVNRQAPHSRPLPASSERGFVFDDGFVNCRGWPQIPAAPPSERGSCAAAISPLGERISAPA